MGKFLVTEKNGVKYEIEGDDVNSPEDAYAKLSEMKEIQGLDSDTLGVAKQFAEGFTFGGFGEITAGAAVLKDWLQRGMPSDYQFGKMYEGAERQIQGRMDKYAKHNRKKSIAANLVGGVTTGGAGLARALGTKAVKALPTAGRWAAGSAVGSAEGAAAGALTAAPGSRAKGAVVGGVAGAALPLAVNLGGSALSKFAIDPILTRMSGNVRGNRGLDFVETAMARDKLTPDGLAKEMDEIGPGAMPVDAGPNLRALGDYAVNRPGTAKTIALEAVGTRKAGQVDRILARVEDATGPASREVVERVDDNPVWQRVLDKPIELTGDLMRYLNRPSVRKAWEKARAAEREGDVPMLPFDKKAARKMAKEEGWDEVPPSFMEMVNAGNITQVQTRLLHTVKQAMDDVIEGTKNKIRNSVTGELPRGDLGLKAQRRSRSKFRDEVKAQNPEYKGLLKASHDEFKIDEALEAGLTALNKRGRDIKQQMSRMSPREKRAYRQSVLKDIGERIGKSRDTERSVTGTMLNFGPKLRIIFGDRGKTLVKGLKGEKRMADTNASFGGSQTQGRQMNARDIEGGAAADFADAAVGAAATGGKNLLGRAASGLFRLGGKPPGPVVEDIAKLLFSGDKTKIAQAIAALNARRTGSQRLFSGGLRSGVAGGAAVGSGMHGNTLLEK